jgi:membrane protein YqaA with SNARE-associated domain
VLSGHWRSFFLALIAVAAVGLVIVIAWPELAGLFLLGVYCIPANSVIPIPHEPGVLYMAQFYDPLWIALAATAGSVVVSFSDYAMVEAAMRSPKTERAQNSALFRALVRCMKWKPFPTVIGFSLLPLPISLVRVLAPASGYPIGRYIVAQIIGRIPRFYVLAWIGAAVSFPAWLLIAMFAAMVVTIYVTNRATGEAEDETEAEAEADADDAIDEAGARA